MQANVKSYTVYLGLGSNWFNKYDQLLDALAFINFTIGSIEAVSSIFESEAVGFNSDSTFYNMCLVLKTRLSPDELLNKLLEYETKCGRVRISNTYTDRPVDLDILYIDDLIIHTDNLVVPHPGIFNRDFVVIPLIELADKGFAPFGFHASLKKYEKQMAHSLVKMAVSAQIIEQQLLKKN